MVDYFSQISTFLTSGPIAAIITIILLACVMAVSILLLWMFFFSHRIPCEIVDNYSTQNVLKNKKAKLKDKEGVAELEIKGFKGTMPAPDRSFWYLKKTLFGVTPALKFVQNGEGIMGLVPIRVVDDPNDPEGIRFKQVFQPGRVQWFIGVLKEIQARNAKQSAFLQYAPMIMTAGVLIFSFLIIFFLLQKMEVVTLQMAQTSAQNAETQRMFLDFVKQNSINVVKPA